MASTMTAGDTRKVQTAVLGGSQQVAATPAGMSYAKTS